VISGRILQSRLVGHTPRLNDAAVVTDARALVTIRSLPVNRPSLLPDIGPSLAHHEGLATARAAMTSIAAELLPSGHVDAEPAGWALALTERDRPALPQNRREVTSSMPFRAS